MFYADKHAIIDVNLDIGHNEVVARPYLMKACRLATLRFAQLEPSRQANISTRELRSLL